MSHSQITHNDKPIACTIETSDGDWRIIDICEKINVTPSDFSQSETNCLHYLRSRMVTGEIWICEATLGGEILIIDFWCHFINFLGQFY